MADGNGFDKDEALFLSIMYSFHAAAMQQMGKIANPFTGKVERDLDAARGTIDVLAMFQKKTQGNLTDRERRVLTNLITELQLNYIDESKREPAAEKTEPAAGGEEKAPAAEEEPQPEKGETPRAEEAREAEAEKAGPQEPEKKPAGKRRPAKKKKED